MVSREHPRRRPKPRRAQAMGCVNRSEYSSVQGMWPKWNSEGCEPLPARSPPSCRARFGFRAEVPLAPRLTDARTFIVAITGDVVDTSPAVVADVALDTAGTPITCSDGRRVPGGGLQAIAPAPVPWRNELSSPHAAPLSPPPPRRCTSASIDGRPTPNLPRASQALTSCPPCRHTATMRPYRSRSRSSQATERLSIRPASACVAWRPQGQGRLAATQLCALSGASTPKRRTRAEPTSIVSPSITRARPARSD